jgi:hypothetical protein
MRSVTLLTFLLLIGAGCMKQTVPSGGEHSNTTGNKQPESTPTPGTEVVAKDSDNKDKGRAFAAVDFKNFSYPTRLKGKVTLKDGTRIYESAGGGGDTFELRDVNYADITGDGKEEAIVHLLLVSCGGSCDGGSHLFYFYSAGQKNPALLSRMETGSAAYDGCALKSFVLRQQKLELELFRSCRVSGLTFQSLKDNKGQGGKFEAHSFTRFFFQFAGVRFVLKNMEVLPFPEGNVMNYKETVSVN